MFFEIVLDGFGCDWQIVMWDLGEEQMVRDMTIGNVVSESINAKSESSIYGFKGGEGKVPVAIIVHDCVVVVVLEIGDAVQPPSKDSDGHQVDVGHVHERVVEQVCEQGKVREDNGGGDEAFDVLTWCLLKQSVSFTVWPPVIAIWAADQINLPRDEWQQWFHPSVIFQGSHHWPIAACQFIRGDPRVRVVVIDMVVVHVMTIVGQSPRVIRH